MDTISEDAADLRHRIRDLVALTALPVLWLGNLSATIVDSLAETLLPVLDAGLVYVCVRSGDSAAWTEAVRVDAQSLGDLPASVWLDKLRPLFESDQIEGICSLQLPPIALHVPAFCIALGYRDVCGYIVAAARRPGFPNETESLLCQVAANEAAIALHEAGFRQQLSETLTILKTITDNTAACLYLIDDRGRCTYMNPAGEKTFGYTFDELRGKVLHDVIHFQRADGSRYPISECPLNTAAERGQSVPAYEEVMIRKDGDHIPMLCAANPIIQDGVLIATLIEAHDITERKRVEKDLWDSAKREILVSRIGLAIRGSLVPNEIEHTAVQLLGQALRAHRCFFAHLDIDHDYIRFGADWVRPGLPSLTGEFTPSQFQIDQCGTFAAGDSVVIDDVAAAADTWPAATRELLDSAHIRALIAVPLYRDGKLVALLCAASETRRMWRPEDIDLAESVAAHTRTAIDAASVLQREHRIATALQDALIPPIPDRPPGLDIATHYQAALEESRVGGDFYAVYPLDNTRMAVIIGDVSGKGLAAATQVATLQNMLRYALCAANTVSVAVTEMNGIVISQGLLTGFATLFVGVYDTIEQKLTYTSCGHEPALVRHGSGEIEELGCCGPPLGVAVHAQYPARVVQFHAGDTLFLYTDGLSEAGPDRRNLLGIPGLASLLRAFTPSSASSLVEHIVSQAKAYGNGWFRDDVCVVAALITE